MRAAVEVSGRSIVNAMTVDVEDYFHVSAFERIVPRSAWGSFDSRVCQNTDRLMELFDHSSVHATFFVLGWVADRFPQLVRRIAAAGHEIASHGYAHRLVYEQTPAAFREDLRRAKGAIESAAGVAVRGYRAPSFSITERSMWALDVLIEEGFWYDASIFPIHHDRYGIPDAPRHLHRLTRPSGSIWELPGSTVVYGGLNIPVAGGGYFRIMPYAWTRWAIDTVNRREHQPVVCYVHPWEIDPDQPRLAASVRSRIRHYTSLARTSPRLSRMLSDFSFAPISTVLDRQHVLDEPQLAKVAVFA
jgi:polysaccharide deacetylase family protein (PEP-CTERM system associated)